MDRLVTNNILEIPIFEINFGKAVENLADTRLSNFRDKNVFELPVFELPVFKIKPSSRFIGYFN